MQEQLTQEQQTAFNYLTHGFNVFITGPGGSGKSFLIDKFYKYYTEYKNCNIYKTSSTGASAILIGGSTLHSWAGVKLGEGSVDDLIYGMTSFSKDKWRFAKVLIIDEISMINPDFFDKLEEIGRRLRKSRDPFGGIQIAIFGDFFQLPVVKCERFCFEAKSWNSVVNKVVVLKHIIRQDDDIFRNLLSEIRLGEINTEHEEILKSRIHFSLKNSYGIEPTKLFSRNCDVNKINSDKLKLLEGVKHEYRAEYKIVYNSTNFKDSDIIDKLRKSEEVTPEILTLAKGAQVVIKRNLDVEHGIANGSRGVVIDFKEVEGNLYPVVRILNGLTLTIPPYSFEYENGTEYKVVKSQIPLKLAWASTIHSCQGSTLDYVEADVGSSIFEYGQAYVVLSRVRKLDGLSLIDFKKKSIKASPKVIEYYKNLEQNEEENEEEKTKENEKHKND